MNNLIVKHKKNVSCSMPSSPMPLSPDSNRRIRNDVKIALNKFPSKLEVFTIKSLWDNGMSLEEIQQEYGKEVVTLLTFWNHFKQEIKDLP